MLVGACDVLDNFKFEESARRVLLITAAKSGAVINVEGVAVAAVIIFTLQGFYLCWFSSRLACLKAGYTDALFQDDVAKGGKCFNCFTPEGERLQPPNERRWRGLRNQSTNVGRTISVHINVSTMAMVSSSPIDAVPR